MPNKEFLMKFKDEFPFAKVSDFRPICHELFTDGKQGITIWLEDGSVVEYYPNTRDDNERMTREEAIKILEYTLECVDEETPKGANEAEAIPMAIEALKAGRLRGKWIYTTYTTKRGGGCRFKCSVCGEEITPTQWNYCPNCGADMTEGSEANG